MLLCMYAFQNRSLMRGQHGNAMSSIVLVVFKLLFLACILGPGIMWLDQKLDAPIPVVLIAGILYAITFVDLSEINGGRRWLWARDAYPLRYIVNRFQMKMVKTVDLDPNKQYIICLHPHGILPFGSGSSLFVPNMPNGFPSLFPELKYRLLIASFSFYIPFYRDFLLGVGAVDASRFSALKVIENGESICLYPGGATEALYSNPNKDVLYLNNRTGFIKMALACGVPLVPVFSFNENNTFSQFDTNSPLIKKIKVSFQKMIGFSLPILKNIIPKFVPITLVAGAPIEIPKIENPTKADLEKYLQMYRDSLKNIYEKHHKAYNMPWVADELEFE